MNQEREREGERETVAFSIYALRWGKVKSAVCKFLLKKKGSRLQLLKKVGGGFSMLQPVVLSYILHSDSACARLAPAEFT